MAIRNLSILCLLGLAASAARGGDAVSMPAGKYEGEIWSNSLRPGTTTFLSSSTSLIGEYQFETASGTESGTLRACRETSPLRWQCEWRDAYGKGLLDMEFSQSYDSFDGVWSDGNNPRSLGLTWNGRRTASNVEGR